MKPVPRCVFGPPKLEVQALLDSGFIYVAGRDSGLRPMLCIRVECAPPDATVAHGMHPRSRHV